MTDQHPGPGAEEIEPFEDFVRRHVGTSEEDQAEMLKVLGYDALDDLIDAAVPGSVRSLGALDLPPAVSEQRVLAELRDLASRNLAAEPMIGLGYHAGLSRTLRRMTPGVIVPW